MKTSLAIAVAQFNPVVGDVSGNVAQIRAAMAAAEADGARVLLTPELSICGYPPEDLLLRPDFYDSCRQAVEALAGLEHLELLNLNRTHVSDAGLAALHGHGSLRIVYVESTRASAVAVSKLIAALPRCRVISGGDIGLPEPGKASR